MKGVLVLWIVVGIVQGEFRFCKNGPQRMRDTDCPGGFYARSPINVSCAYYASSKPVAPGSQLLIIPDSCEDGKMPVEISAAGGSASITTFQELSYVLSSPSEESTTSIPLPMITGLFEPEDVCQESACLAEWVDPNAVQGEDKLEDRPPQNESLGDVEREVTRRLLTKLLMEETFDEDVEPETPPPFDPLWGGEPESGNSSSPLSRLHRLLAKSMQIMWTHCKPYVSDGMLRVVLRAMLTLDKLNQGDKMEMGLNEFRRIWKALERCQTGGNRVFRLVGGECNDSTVASRVESVEYLRDGSSWKMRRTARSFVWGMYDPIVETAWAAVDFVHGFCFPAFAQDVVHHHLYTAGMLEGLFPPTPVQQHWLYPTTISPAVWASFLEIGDVKDAMRNIDACIIGGYGASPFVHRLERPFTPEEMLEKPTYTAIDDGEGGNKGWTKSLKQYWTMYEGMGGFKRISKGWGYCLQENDSETKEIMSQEIKSKCPPPP